MKTIWTVCLLAIISAGCSQDTPEPATAVSTDDAARKLNQGEHAVEEPVTLNVYTDFI